MKLPVWGPKPPESHRSKRFTTNILGGVNRIAWLSAVLARRAVAVAP